MRFALFLFVFLFFSYTSEIEAARNLTISSNSNFLLGDQEMTITASTSGFISGEKIHVKGAFYKDGSTNYFGFTKSNEMWVKNSEPASSQLEVLIGTWDQFVIVKSDYFDSGFNGKSNYNFKLGYYYFTSGGNMSSVNWSNVINVGLEEPLISEIPSQYKISTPLISVASSPSPTSVKYQNISKDVKSDLNSDKIIPENKIASDFATIKRENNKEKEIEPKVLGVKNKSNWNIFILIGVGGILLLIGGIYLIYNNFEFIKIWLRKE